MNYQLLKNFFFVLILSTIVVSCKKKPVQPTEETTSPTTLSNGILVLNEGLFQQNNASLSWIDLSTNSVNSSFFEQKTTRSLGDTGNDIKRYGNKIYVIVNVSSTIEVLNATTGAFIQQIDMKTASGDSKQPRYIAFNGSKAYVSCYDGFVDVIDTATLAIQQRIPVGSNPEGLCVANNKLYVANSGGLNYPNVDSTLSVISLSTYNELTKIVVGKNPGRVVADQNGEVYAITRGNYSTIPQRMHRINTTTDNLEETFPMEVGSIVTFGNKFLLTTSDFSGSNTSIQLFNPQSELVENSNFIDVSSIETLYGINYSSTTGKIYVMDARGFSISGKLKEYSLAGNFIREWTVGLNPTGVLIF